jgi:molecular chaperone DnaK
MAKDNRTIGRFFLDGIPSSMRGVPQIEVTFDIDANGIINVTALDKGTNKKQDIRIEASSGLSKEDIERMKKEAEMNSESDKKDKEDVETLNMGDSMVFNVEKSMKDLDEKLTEEQKIEITEVISKIKESLSKKDVDSVKNLTDELNLKFQKITQDIYSQSNQPMGDMNFEGSDVDFEEVKG